ncbi:hypothetical protein C8R44DRAFT_945346 [Mycena epipterygia]|nr:hypothetical protein C8R44DRAFT_945346 [Mycena epipterygia]
MSMFMQLDTFASPSRRTNPSQSATHETQDVAMTSPPNSPEKAASDIQPTKKSKKRKSSDKDPHDDSRASKKKASVTKPAARHAVIDAALLVKNINRAKLTCARLDSETATQNAKNASIQLEIEQVRLNVIEAERVGAEEKLARAVALQEAISHTKLLELQIARLQQKENSTGTHNIFGANRPIPLSANATSARNPSSFFGAPAHAQPNTSFSTMPSTSAPFSMYASTSSHRKPSPTRQPLAPMSFARTSGSFGVVTTTETPSRQARPLEWSEGV